MKHVRSGSEADIFGRVIDVRCAPIADIVTIRSLFYCLLGECERLAERLEIPDDINIRTEAFRIAADDSQGEGQAVRQHYGVESYTCVALMEGCRTAIETGAALAIT